ncbi:uncharacterized protein MONOS_432 [Monocercomonoides exilis]|uniref:uncharacterized protein n=1 Tax=Monocercomonoides exilis TaxID=2049356 RepID=UPI00355A1C27|nr:hypothetical protein MONOS_432 [Monocercomonoides exilis]|eukprot:MONOS_432.1-p1 / transcript=MONOS_432.1 / gene=MONOS_432 / organism=Monocercomonoides_exilis_PA203 / gene_product=unspecified product / transcript_product=unspecified product / location=Mono_scaffold00007:56798-57421(-) / protein_length=169 / sequence_SO=supercontig / SO=protein_coding / is_pseudo=false
MSSGEESDDMWMDIRECDILQNDNAGKYIYYHSNLTNEKFINKSLEHSLSSRIYYTSCSLRSLNDASSVIVRVEFPSGNGSGTLLSNEIEVKLPEKKYHEKPDLPLTLLQRAFIISFSCFGSVLIVATVVVCIILRKQRKQAMREARLLSHAESDALMRSHEMNYSNG